MPLRADADGVLGEDDAVCGDEAAAFSQVCLGVFAEVGQDSLAADESVGGGVTGGDRLTGSGLRA